MKLGVVGWRGMVGTVLMQRMAEEGDIAACGAIATFFSTSADLIGRPSPLSENSTPQILDARDTTALAQMDVIISAQGSDYTNATLRRLLPGGDVPWAGVLIDASSALRHDPAATLALDPVNGAAMRACVAAARAAGRPAVLAGANCTVSILLLGLLGVIDDVDWVWACSYQAASGAGAAAVAQLLAETRAAAAASDPAAVAAAEGGGGGGDAGVLARASAAAGGAARCATEAGGWGVPLYGSVQPWIDAASPPGEGAEGWDGRTLEEVKGDVEARRLLADRGAGGGGVVFDGVCVRVPALRSHALAVTFRLTAAAAARFPDANAVATALAAASPWAAVVPPTRAATLAGATSAARAGSLEVGVARIRAARPPPGSGGEGRTYSAFVCGDQLLWGAAEPLRRALRMACGVDVTPVAPPPAKPG